MKDPQGKYTTASGIPVDPVYREFTGQVPDPGSFPFTRGIHPDMYRGKMWTMRQYAGFSTAEESNQRYHYLLEKGTTGLSVAFDLPTQIGYDSDHPMAAGEVGKVGVAIDSLQDMEILFRGIELAGVTTSMTINATAPILLAMYLALARKQGADLKKISGTVQNDILKEYAARGTYIYPPEPSMRLITDVFAYCAREVPRWNTISISGYHMREAGCTAVQELAFTLANGKAYLKAAMEAGQSIDDLAPRLSFFFNAHNDFFEEIAKFRAARTLWAQIVKDMGAQNPRSMMLRFHTQTGGSTLTAQQPLNNIIRVTVQAMAAILGGTQSLHTNGFDEALSLPTEKAARIALRTQQILAGESNVALTADPLGGSFFIEQLTRKVMEEAQILIQKIDEMGGAVRAIEAGYVQDEIAHAAYIHQKEIEAGTRQVVGVNVHKEEETLGQDLMQIDESVARAQKVKLEKLRAGRDNVAVQSRLMALTHAAGTKENLMPYIMECVESYATLGEVSDALRKVFGEYRG